MSNLLFDNAVNAQATLNYAGCRHVGKIIEVRWIDGELNYHIEFPDTYKTKAGRMKKYNWSAIYDSHYVIILKP